MTYDPNYPTQTDMSPAAHIKLVTPSDTDTIDPPLRGISFNNLGTLKVTMATDDPDDVGQAVIIPSGSLCSGIIHPIRIIKLWASDTSISGSVGYY